MASDRFPKWDYKEYPKSLPPDDLWGQVRRTVYGKPVPEDQIQLIVDAIVEGLELKSNSVVLDIGCGNAALAARVFPYCGECLGVDFSEYLISVANSRFASSRHKFVCMDAVEYVAQESEPLRFDKALCFGMFAYLSDADAQRLLTLLYQRFLNLGTIFIGSIPDPAFASSFFDNRDLSEIELDSPQSQIGVWRSREKITAMAEAAGWRARFHHMPPEFYQSHYRYNAILERPA